MIRLRFTGGTSPAARAIQAFTWSWASHVDFEIDGRLLGAVPGGGVCWRDIEAAPAGRVERFAIPGLDRATEDMLIALAASQISKPYDWSAILGFLCRRDWQASGAWFCSELVAWACQQAGHPLLRTDRLGRITPHDLLLSPFLIPLNSADQAIPSPA